MKTDPHSFHGRTDIDYAKKIVICWNSYVNGAGRQVIKAATINGPIPILKTGFTIGEAV